MPLSAYQPGEYQILLSKKLKQIKSDFAEFNIPEPEVFDSPLQHYRMRAEFRVWHEGDESYFAMFRQDDPKTPHRVSDFPIGSKAINRLIKVLPQQLQSTPILRQRLFQVEILSTLSGEILLTLIYHKKLDDAWMNEAEKLAQQLNIELIGRSKKQKVVVTKDYVTETLNVAGKSYHYQQLEGSFTQPNAEINQKMLHWALEQSHKLQGDLLELYCGNGNFTVVLAQNFRQVLATEISKTSVRSARENLNLNHIDNVDIVRMSSEEFTQALNGTRPFRRLKEIDLNSYAFSTVLVDPPRAGLDENTEALISRFDNILYISCNPETLKRNLETITRTHQVASLALFDQFPYTRHIECGVLLRKKEL